MKTDPRRPILTITGSDSTGASGIQADTRTIHSLGGVAASAVTSITVQTSIGIQEFFDVPAPIVAGQVEAVMNDLQPNVVKIGLIRRADVLQVVVDALQKYHPSHVVYVPTMRSTLGEPLVSTEVAHAIANNLLPLCTTILPPDKLSTPSKHGLANAYASAVAVFLNQGATEAEALERAQSYIQQLQLRQEGLSGRAPELFREFQEAVARHHRTNSDVAFYADRLNVSPRYLAQVCRRMGGKSPKAIIDEQLTEAIKTQLATTGSTIQEIAYAFGFSSQAHFTKFFKRACGLTPTAYRQKATL